LLNLATERNSSAHSSIGTPSPGLCRAPTACRHTVSGTISLPSRGAFHLSLTVLVHYRSSGVFSLGEWSPQIPTEFHVFRGTQDPVRSRLRFRLRDSHPLWWTVPGPSTIGPIGNSNGPSYNPTVRRRWFGLFPVRSPLLGEYFLFLEVLRCFSSPGSLHPAYVFSRR
jgi:hypothetical protein